ncbi:hypothetical protein AWB78_05850 [Caballeronia calidae]|uniref:Uncharacterized protein n=2 Tax=Caballeronia calidae TaxID=1777139 RepID=A0A158DZB9_9BURK|nr:hypothetical protein AWB78_05850 [Caballeronia calidae]
MEHVRGLAPKTRSMALRIVGRLLTTHFGEGTVDVAAIRAEHVRRFFTWQAKHYGANDVDRFNGLDADAHHYWVYP